VSAAEQRQDVAVWVAQMRKNAAPWLSLRRPNELDASRGERFVGSDNVRHLK
jgi:hypothetical protein